MRMVKSVEATRSSRSLRACITSLAPISGPTSPRCGNSVAEVFGAPRSTSNAMAARLAAVSSSWHVHSSGADPGRNDTSITSCRPERVGTANAA